MNAHYSPDTKIISVNGDHYYDDKRFVLTEFSADTLKEEGRENIYMRMVGSIPEFHIKGR